jgi:hypothetical protein
VQSIWLDFIKLNLDYFPEDLQGPHSVKWEKCGHINLVRFTEENLEIISNRSGLTELKGLSSLHFFANQRSLDIVFPASNYAKLRSVHFVKGAFSFRRAFVGRCASNRRKAPDTYTLLNLLHQAITNTGRSLAL